VKLDQFESSLVWCFTVYNFSSLPLWQKKYNVQQELYREIQRLPTSTVGAT